MRTYETIHEAYLATIADVMDHPDYICSPRGLEIYEKTDYSFRVTKPEAASIVTKDEERNLVIAEYTKKEMDLYNSGSNLVADFAKASKFWNKIVNPDNTTINSAYGHLIWHKPSQGNHEFEGVMRTPWEYAKQCLLADKDTRQAVMAFALPEHRWLNNKDQVCTIAGNWLIRDNKLNLHVTMRSNDLAKGLPYDISWFVSLIDKMRDELKEAYPDLEVGSYTHTAWSMHIYTKDFNIMKKMIGRE
jgi:thymidylate synthase